MNVKRPHGHWWLVNISSGNGMVPSGNKPLTLLMLSWPRSVLPCGVTGPQSGKHLGSHALQGHCSKNLRALQSGWVKQGVGWGGVWTPYPQGSTPLPLPNVCLLTSAPFFSSIVWGVLSKLIFFSPTPAHLTPACKIFMCLASICIEPCNADVYRWKNKHMPSL